MPSIPLPVHDPVPSPTVSASRKKPKTSQSVASLSTGAPSPAMHPSMQPSSSALRPAPPSGPKGKKPKSVGPIFPECKSKRCMDVFSFGFHCTVRLIGYILCCISGKSMQLSTGLTGRAQVANRGSSEAATYDPLIGRKVWTRWPEDNHFYEAVITDYNPIEVSSTVDCAVFLYLMAYF